MQSLSVSHFCLCHMQRPARESSLSLPHANACQRESSLCLCHMQMPASESNLCLCHMHMPEWESSKEAEDSWECEEGVRECVTLFLEMLPFFALVVPLRTARDLPRSRSPVAWGLTELDCEPSRFLLCLDLKAKLLGYNKKTPKLKYPKILKKFGFRKFLVFKI